MPISSVTHLLIHYPVTISREQEINKGKGRWQDNLVTLAIVRGRVWTGSGTESIIGQERKTYTGTIGYFEPTQDINVQDYVNYNGVDYRVTAILDPSIPHHRKVALEQIQIASL